MIPLDQFQDHLDSLEKKDWDTLFDLLPEIENSSIFGELEEGKKDNEGDWSIPYWNPAPIVDKTIDIICQLNLSPSFDWSSWDEGKMILRDTHVDYMQLDTITLCKLFTVIIRADRFNDGFLISCFRAGIISRIIKGLMNKINGRVP